MKIPGSTRPPRIHGELLKLGFEVAQSSVAKYMVKRRGPPSQGWRTFLRNHAPDIAAMDLFVVPTIGFDLLYVFVIVRLDRRDIVWINVTAHPTAEWVARQITEAFPWNEARFSPSSANRCGQVTCRPGRTSSQRRPCLGFRYTLVEKKLFRCGFANYASVLAYRPGARPIGVYVLATPPCGVHKRSISALPMYP